MPTIVSCPKCRDQVTLPPEPYSGLICPHCQVEFSMQPTLRQQGQGPYSSLRQELARDVQAGLKTPLRPSGGVALAEIGDAVIALPHRRSPSLLAMAGQLVGLLGGGAMGLAVGYCLLTYLGGAHFNVLELPLPWLSPMAAHAPADEERTPGGTAVRQAGSVTPSPSAANAVKPPSQATPRMDAPAAPADSGPRLTAASEVSPGANPPADSAQQGVREAAFTEKRPTSTGIVANVAATSTVPRTDPPRPGSPRYSLADLTQAADAARDALSCPTCKSTGFVTRSLAGRETPQRCPVCRGAGGAGITAEVYAKLCRLAEVTTHADASDETVLTAQRGLASLLRKANDRSEKQAAIGRHAAQRISAPPGDAKGILLVGTIDRKEQVGHYHLARLVLLGEPAPVQVLSSSPIPFQPGEKAIIAGSLIADPSAELADYSGPRGPLVWGGMPLRLEE